MKRTSYLNRLLIIFMMTYLSPLYATEVGLFWQMKSPTGKTSYLFGTMHSDDNRVTEFNDAVMNAIAKTDAFVMETKPGGDSSHYFMQDTDLAALLSEAELDKVRALTEFHVMHYDQAIKMKPWLLSIVFSQSKPHTPFAQDNLLMRAAEDRGKSIQELETSEEHFTVIDDFTIDEQLTMLRAALRLTDAQKEKDFEQLLQVYLRADSDAILALDEAITGNQIPKALWKKIHQRILIDRNKLMTVRAVKLANEQPTFIAVGAAHLAGESGLLAAFKQAGYQLSLISNWLN